MLYVGEERERPIFSKKQETTKRNFQKRGDVFSGARLFLVSSEIAFFFRFGFSRIFFSLSLWTLFPSTEGRGKPVPSSNVLRRSDDDLKRRFTVMVTHSQIMRRGRETDDTVANGHSSRYDRRDSRHEGRVRR